MKTLLMATCVAVVPAIAFAAGSQCSVPEFPADTHLASGTTQSELLPPISLPEDAGPPDPSSTALALPTALQHMVNAGATITSLGDHHSMPRFVARTGDQLMVFSLTPDGQAIVAGLMADFSTADLSKMAGPNLTQMGFFHGLRAMVIRSGSQFQVFYGTPDGERVIPGVMWDTSGKNLTRGHVASIAGLVPTVVIGDIPTSPAENGGNAIASSKALSDLAAIRTTAFVARLVAETVEVFGGVHILVNNAGFPRDGFLTKMTEEDWDLVVDVTLKGAFLACKAVMPHLIAQNWGRVISISSRAYLGNPGQANYSAAKAGLLGLTRALAIEEGRYNITVNAVAPGFIATEMVRALPNYETVKDRAVKATPIPRPGEPSDIADAVAFLASSRASHITGETLHVTGGRY